MLINGFVIGWRFQRFALLGMKEYFQFCLKDKNPCSSRDGQKQLLSINFTVFNATSVHGEETGKGTFVHNFPGAWCRRRNFPLVFSESGVYKHQT